MNCALNWSQSSSEVPFTTSLIYFDFEILMQRLFVIVTLWFVLSICYIYKETYNMIQRTLQSIDLINLYNEIFRRTSTTYISTKENTKLIAFGLPYNAGMLSPCNLYVYHNATLTNERIYATVSIVSEI